MHNRQLLNLFIPGLSVLHFSVNLFHYWIVKYYKLRALLYTPYIEHSLHCTQTTIYNNLHTLPVHGTQTTVTRNLSGKSQKRHEQNSSTDCRVWLSPGTDLVHRSLLLHILKSHTRTDSPKTYRIQSITPISTRANVVIHNPKIVQRTTQ